MSRTALTATSAGEREFARNRGFARIRQDVRERTGAKTLMLTLNLDHLGRMSCNPAAGIGKGHFAQEVVYVSQR